MAHIARKQSRKDEQQDKVREAVNGQGYFLKLTHLDTVKIRNVRNGLLYFVRILIQTHERLGADSKSCRRNLVLKVRRF